MLLPPYTLHKPRSVDEAVELAQRYNGDCDFLAGGTDLLPNYKQHLNHRGHVIALSQVKALTEISADRIGAGARLVDVTKAPDIRQHYPSVVETIGLIASPLLREAGTMGGNLLVDTRCYFFNQSDFWRDARGDCLKTCGDECHVVQSDDKCFAAYSGDLAPLLIALGCRFGVAGPSGTREVKAAEFFVDDGIRRHVLEPSELLTHVAFPPEARDLKAGYQKLRFRATLDFPAAGVAVALNQNGDGAVETLRVVVNAVASAPLLMNDLTDPLVGTHLTEDAIDRLAGNVMGAIQPLKVSAISPQYRKKMVGLYVRQLLRSLTGGA